MSIERGHWGVDLHCHAADIHPRGDAPRNVPQATLSVYRTLLDAGSPVNTIAFLCHDGFPGESIDKARREFPGVEIIVGSEIATRVPDSLKDETRKKLIPMVHVIGIFPERPVNWPFQVVNWPKSLISRLRTIIDILPPLDEVFSAIEDTGGIAVIAHPSPLWVPWSSLRLTEIASLRDRGLLDGVALEVNGCTMYQLTKHAVERFAMENNIAVVGGSDAHKPHKIGRQATVFPKLTGDPFVDLKTAIKERTTKVVKGRTVGRLDRG